ncbi:MAG: CoB--CoM heterodisulfide reductase subunit C [Methanobacteriaceae archaeon]
MRSLRRLKNILTGEDSEEKKKSEKPENTAEAEKVETPPNQEQESKVQEETEKAAEEDKGDQPETVKSEKPEVQEKEETPTETSEKDVEPAAEVQDEPEKTKPKRSERMSLLQEKMDENLITRGDIDPEFKQEVIDAGAETLAICFQCGTCTGACPSGRRTPYRIRQVVRRSLEGLKQDVIADDTLWMCTTCYECQERCPRGIKIVDIVKIVRNHAAQAGYMAEAHKMTGSYVIKTGHGVPINDATMALRKSVGLGELPPTTHQFPEALEEVQKIFKTTGFDNLIGYNWDTGKIE